MAIDCSTQGGFFESNCDAYLNYVRADGEDWARTHPCRELAYEFEKQFPMNALHTRIQTQCGQLKSGEIYVWNSGSKHRPYFILNLAADTRGKWAVNDWDMINGRFDINEMAGVLAIKTVAVMALTPVFEQAFLDAFTFKGCPFKASVFVPDQILPPVFDRG